MAVRNEIITITVDTKGGEIKINEVTTSLKGAKVAFEAATASVEKNTTAHSKSAAELQKEISVLTQLRNTTARTSAEYNKQSKTIAELQSKLTQLTATGNQVTRVNAGMASSAGLAGAATMELGRIASDFNYGIRGIANNVSQFASLFVSLSISAGGAGKALKEIGKQISGPLGILLAIQAVIALIEGLDRKFGFFNKKVNEADKALEKFNEELSGRQGSIELLKTYAKIVQDVNGDLDDQKLALNKLKKEGYDPTIGSIEQFIEAQGKLAVIQSLSELFKEETKSIISQRRELDDQIEEANSKIALLRDTFTEEQLKQRAVVSGTAGGAAQMTPAMRLKTLQNQVQSLTTERGNLFDQLDSLSDDLRIEIERILDDNPFLSILLGGKGDTDEDKRDPVQSLLSNFLQRRSSIIDETKAINDKLLTDDIDSQEKVNLLKLDLEYFYLREKLKANGATNKELLALDEAYFIDRGSMVKKYAEEYLKEEKKTIGKSGVEEFLKRFSNKVDETAKNSNDALLNMLKNQQEMLKQFKNSIGSLSDLISNLADSRRATLEAQIEGIESNTKRQLANERLSEEERNQIRANAEQRKIEIQKQSIKSELKFQQAMFAMKAAELALDISMAIKQSQIDAARAKSSIVADSAKSSVTLKAGASKAAASAPPPFNLPSILAYAAQAAIIVTGIIKAKREAKAALASIGQSVSFGPDPSADSFGGPTFNVVGSTGTSQIADVIGAANQKPIKAYVVSDEITNAQQLDQRIVENAGI